MNAPIQKLLNAASDERTRLILGMIGLILLIKRSPPEVEGLLNLTATWAGGMWRFLTDPENAGGLILVLNWVWPRESNGK